VKTDSINSKARRGRFLSTLPLTGLLTLAACGGSSGGNGNEPEPGAWTTGDLHVHTVQSDDSRTTQTLDLVLGKAFTSNNLDWMAVTNHLRSPPRWPSPTAWSPTSCPASRRCRPPAPMTRS
jgi:hypothetical protein